MKKYLLTIILLLCCASTINADSFNFNSYYPAPYGAYQKIKLVPRDLIDGADMGDPCDQIGTLYIYEDTSAGTGQTRFCKDDGAGNGVWGMLTGTWTQVKDAGQKKLFPTDTENHNGTADATNYYRVGIGTAEPVARGLTIVEQDMVVDFPDLTAEMGIDAHNFVLAAQDPRVVMVCEDESTGCAAISFVDIDPTTGDVLDVWSIGRNASTPDGPGPDDVQGLGVFTIAYTDMPPPAWGHAGLDKLRVLTIRPNGNTGFGKYEGATHGTFPNQNLHIINDDGLTAIRIEELDTTTEVDTDKRWELRSLEGGAGVDRFSIWGGYDGTETEQLVIDKDGQVGVGTTEPLTRLHVVGDAGNATLRIEGDEPTITMFETGPSNLTYRFRVNDGMLKLESNGEPGGVFMPALSISDSGQVGFGPFREVIDNAGTFAFTEQTPAALALGSDGHLQLDAASIAVNFIDDDAGAMDFNFHTWAGVGLAFDAGPFPDEWTSGQWHHRIFSIKASNGWLGFGLNYNEISHPMHFSAVMANNAYLDTSGTRNPSSIEYKKDVQPLSLEVAQSILHNLDTVSYYHIKDEDKQRVGFIAEDIPDLVAEEQRKGIAATGILSVLTKNIQQHEESSEALNKEMEKANATLEKLNSKISQF